ncbi:MAG: hypothetical protein WD995_03085 [Gemmatimonadota bacterium]
MLREVDDFLEGWAAHGRPLRSAREVVGDRFLLVGVDVDAAAPSGCSIDALVHRLEELAHSLDITLNDHTPVRYRAENGIVSASRADFRARAEAGAIGPDVRVFDTTLTRVGQRREGRLEGPASASWHGRAFFKAQLHG